MDFSRARSTGPLTPQRLVVDKPRGRPAIRAMGSYEQQPGIEAEGKGKSIKKASPGDWLAETETDLQKDLETTQREVELIKALYQDISKWQSARASDGPWPGREQANKYRAMMASCREYSSSRLAILQERLMQVDFWTRSRDMGRRIPHSSVLGEWHTADANWRRWLSQAAGGRQEPQGRRTADTLGRTPWVLLGPLPYILEAYTWVEETSRAAFSPGPRRYK